MNASSIRSRSHPLVRRARALLSSTKDRDEEGCFAIEGPRLAGEALASPLRIEQALFDPEVLASEAGRELAGRLGARGVPLAAIASGLLASIQDADAPQGIVLIARIPLPRNPRAVEGGLAAGPGGQEAAPDDDAAGPAGRPSDAPIVACWGVQDPGNLGAIARVIEASGGRALHLARGCADPWHPRAVRGSAGSIFRIDVRRRLDPDGMTAGYIAGGGRLVAAVARAGVPFERADLTGPVVLCLGGEGSGLPPDVEAAAVTRVTIPMHGRVESLNVAVSAALLLFEAARQRRSGSGI